MRLSFSGPCPICRAVHGVQYGSAYPSKDARFRLAIILYCIECGSGFVPDGDGVIGDYYVVEYGSEERFNRQINPHDYYRGGLLPPAHVKRARMQKSSLAAAGAHFNRVLDFGAGTGILLNEIQAQHPFAVEPDMHAAKYLDFVGATVLEETEIGQEEFDVVVSSHAIEHLSAERLDATLNRLIGALKIGGIGLIEVPNGGLSYLLKPNYQEPHTLFFTGTGLSAAITRCGGIVAKVFERKKAEIPVREDAIYSPEALHSRMTGRGEGLTCIFRKSKTMR